MTIGPIDGPLRFASPHQPEAIDATLGAPEQQDALSVIGESFLELVVQANASGRRAGAMTKQLALGQSDDIHGTMIAMNKAGIEKSLAVNIKDKVIDAFYEIWRMSL